MNFRGELIKFKAIDAFNTRKMEEYLCDMAANGWMLTSVKFGIRFTACEPKKVKFSIQIVKDASYGSGFSSPDSDAVPYIEFCEESGWKYICGKREIRIFYSEDLSVIAIETDEEAKLDNIHKIYFKRKLYSFFYYTIFYALILYTSLFMYAPEYAYTENIRICFIPLYILGVIFHLIEMLVYCNWHTKAKRCINKNLPIDYNSRIGRTRFLYLFLFLPFIFLIFYGLLFSTNNPTSSYESSNLPITYEDLGFSRGELSDESNEEVSILKKESILAEYEDYSYYVEESVSITYSLEYSVFSSNYKWLLNKYMEDRIYYEYEEIDSTNYKANKVYIRSIDTEFGYYSSTLYAIYDTKILSISLDGSIEGFEKIVYSSEYANLFIEKLHIVD